MEALIKFDRRSFVKVTAVTGGGIMLGFNFLASCTTNKAVIPTEWFDVNAYLKIASDGKVTILSPNPELGQGVKTAMPMVVAEELDIPWESVIVEQAPLDTDKYRRQVAGGSQSIRTTWDSLRMAGATARKMLINAAANKWQVAASECSTADGKVIHAKSKKSLGYGELATAASTMEVPEKVDLKDPKDFKLIGKSVKLVDRHKIVTGQSLYCSDIQKEGMHIAMAIHPPAFGLKLKSFNDKQAKAMPGITHVVSFDNIVAIVGKSTWEVMKARNVLDIDWELSSELESTADHDAKLHDALKRSHDRPSRKDGDPEKTFSEAARILERTYEAPFLPHNTMEPMTCFADVRGDVVEIIAPIQTPESSRRWVGEKLGVPEKNITVMMPLMGGGFGRRLNGDFMVEAAMISKLAGVPVKLFYTREDDMTKGVYRPMLKSTYRAAIDKNNNFTGYHVRGAGINGSAVRPENFPTGAIDNLLVESHQVRSNVTTGAWRSPTHNYSGFAEQAFLDELAAELGKDPIQFRLELLERAIKNPVGKIDYEPERFVGVIKLVAEKAGWGTKKEGVFRGFAVYHSHHSYCAQVVDVVLEDGRPKVKKVWCAIDCGIVINRAGANAQCVGGIMDAIGHALYGELTLTQGVPDQSNFDKYQLGLMADAPEVESFFVDSEHAPSGLGEPPFPTAMGAVANAISAALGRRVYKQPIMENLTPKS